MPQYCQYAAAPAYTPSGAALFAGDHGARRALPGGAGDRESRGGARRQPRRARRRRQDALRRLLLLLLRHGQEELLPRYGTHRFYLCGRR